MLDELTTTRASTPVGRDGLGNPGVTPGQRMGHDGTVAPPPVACQLAGRRDSARLALVRDVLGRQLDA
jgi:hypothetical protein